MARKTVDVKAQIDRVRSLGRDYLPVANLAEIGLAVVDAVRRVGLPRERQKRVVNGPAGRAKPAKPGGEAKPTGELGL